MKRFFFCAVLFALVGCSDKAVVDESTLMTTSFETLYGWLPASQSDLLSREQSHSGLYSTKVDPQHEYSLTYRSTLGDLHDTRISKMKVNAWVFVPDAQAQATLVISISNQGAKPGNMLWEGINLQKEVKGEYGRWVNVSRELTIPAEADDTNRLSIYLWRTGGDKAIFLDDVTLRNDKSVE
ncbi:hypothetical protein F1C16_17835 [Hymenobacter sp. NBH84]|uniref:hypothetical protein n=1 Tax=Hymenobacter sp. NBH84 TaxID=2596915 RepID=UPI0016243173|nr:hypothetical protein [Hymenobacter sp. NBH84]QNE41282.1 hypothetical protein F1C16_17835 [Hymenobacter sp. NBH84]